MGHRKAKDITLGSGSPRQEKQMEAHEWIGAQVSMEYAGRTLLGDVCGIVLEGSGAIKLHVRYFNGESWPTMPFSTEVKDLREQGILLSTEIHFAKDGLVSKSTDIHCWSEYPVLYGNKATFDRPEVWTEVEKKMILEWLKGRAKEKAEG